MAHTTTASVNKLTCNDYVDFDKFQDRFGRFLWSKNDSNYLDVKHKVFKKDDNKEFRLLQTFKMGEADSKEFIRLKYQLVIAAENFARDENLSPVLIPTISKDKEEQLKRVHKVVDVADRANNYLSDPTAVQCGQTREFLRSSPIFCKEEGGKEFSTSCLYES